MQNPTQSCPKPLVKDFTIEQMLEMRGKSGDPAFWQMTNTVIEEKVTARFEKMGLSAVLAEAVQRHQALNPPPFKLSDSMAA